MTETARLDRAIEKVVRRQNCSGCGACAWLDSGLSMELDESGFRRPVRRDPTSTPKDHATRLFEQVCPGRRVGSPRPAGATIHPTLGPVLGAWEAWAADPAIRFQGSSGGVLSALAAWLTESGQLSSIVGAAADQDAPRRTVQRVDHRPGTALAAAGSRYGGRGPGRRPPRCSPGTGLVGKPCEASAARGLLIAGSSSSTEDQPVLLSFFCAGTPSQLATDTARDRARPAERCSAAPAVVPRPRLAGLVSPRRARRRGGQRQLRRVLGRRASGRPSSGAARSARTESARAVTSARPTSGTPTNVATPTSPRARAAGARSRPGRPAASRSSSGRSPRVCSSAGRWRSTRWPACSRCR